MAWITTEQRATRSRHLLERPFVHPLDQPGDLDVGLAQAGEPLVAQAGHDPALG